MREIKYKAWSKELNGFLNITGFECIDGKITGIFHDGDYIGYDKEDIALLEYTRLKDELGKEIYEGDIVEIQNANETKTSYRSNVRVNYNGSLVEAHPAHKTIGIGYERQLSDFIDYGVGYQFHLKCKVIGNIYENPELLKQEMGI